MKPKRSYLWLIPFIAIPILYFAAQFLPFYHSGGSTLPSLWAFFWFPEDNAEAVSFVGLFHHYFRVNNLTFALLGTQLAAIFFLVMVIIKKTNSSVAVMFGCWGFFGLYSFLTTPPLVFSRAIVYGRIASILMLALFLGAVVTSVLHLYGTYKEYKRNLMIVKCDRGTV